jgi:hypothetical protein
MSMIVLVGAGIFAWALLTTLLALLVARAIRLRKQRDLAWAMPVRRAREQDPDGAMSVRRSRRHNAAVDGPLILRRETSPNDRRRTCQDT